MNFSPLIVTVWPALWPPEYRATTLKRSERTSTILPLPSSPHCAPTMTVVFPGFNLLLRFRIARVGRSRCSATSHIRTQLAHRFATGFAGFRDIREQTGSVTFNFTDRTQAAQSSAQSIGASTYAVNW